MSSEPPIRERRRADRVVIRIPVILFGMSGDNRHISEEGETVGISRTGALVRSHTAFKHGAMLEITNKFSRQAEKFRVVWVSDAQKQGCFDLGIEMLSPRDDFWGIKFPSRPDSAQP